MEDRAVIPPEVENLARMIDTRARRVRRDTDELRRLAARLLEACDTPTETEDTHEHYEDRSPVASER